MQGAMQGKYNTHLFLPMLFLPSFLTLQRVRAAAGGCAQPVMERKERWGARPAASSCSELLRWLSRRMSKFNSCVNNGEGSNHKLQVTQMGCRQEQCQDWNGHICPALPFPFPLRPKSFRMDIFLGLYNSAPPWFRMRKQTPLMGAWVCFWDQKCFLCVKKNILKKIRWGITAVCAEGMSWWDWVAPWFSELTDLFWAFHTGKLHGWNGVGKPFKKTDEELMYC